MKTKDELLKLTTTRLLNYYKAERKRMFRQGFTYGVIDEDVNGNELFGWSSSGAHSFWGRSFTDIERAEQIDYLLSIKLELDLRGNIL